MVRETPLTLEMIPRSVFGIDFLKQFQSPLGATENAYVCLFGPITVGRAASILDLPGPLKQKNTKWHQARH